MRRLGGLIAGLLVAASLAAAGPATATQSEDFSDWLNQDWADDTTIGCDIQRDEDGQWYRDSGWWRVDAPGTGDDERDARLISPVLDVGDRGFTVTFDHDFLPVSGNVDFGQLVVIHLVDQETTCAYEDGCEGTTASGGDDRLWCTLDSSYGFGTEVQVPADEADGEIRLMFRYYNDNFYEDKDNGYLRVADVAVEQAPCTPPTSSIDVGSPQHTAGTTYVNDDTPIRLSASSSSAELEYRIDDGDWQPYEGPFTLDGDDGPRTVHYRAGNGDCVEEADQRDLFLDTTPPEVDITHPSPEGSEERSAAEDEAEGALATVQGVCEIVLAPGLCETLTGAWTDEAETVLAETVQPQVEAVRGEVAEACDGVFSPTVCSLIDTALAAASDQLAGGGGSGDAAVVEGETTVRAEAEDPEVGGGASGVERVDFYLDGEHRHTDASAPYEWTFNASREEPGEHTVRAEGVDRVDNAASDVQRVVVAPDEAGAAPGPDPGEPVPDEPCTLLPPLPDEAGPVEEALAPLCQVLEDL